ncbi:hypothetical protein BGX28_008986 [Mortierella sp. GBA30]|nr:hypothetical protein BGX28_008986 [Mortierella sp. GBA30]
MSIQVRSIFEYPELCHTVAECLSYQDYTILARVNKAFYRAFFPYLMPSVVIANTFKYFIPTLYHYGAFTNHLKLPPPNILLKYGEHVHHLNLHFKEKLDFCYFIREDPKDSATTTNHKYRVSTLSMFPGQVQTGLYLSLLEKCPNLGCLQIHVPDSDELPKDRLDQNRLPVTGYLLEQATQKMEIVDDAIAKMIRAASVSLAGDTSVISVTTGTNHESTTFDGQYIGLRKFFLFGSLNFGPSSLQTLIQRHSRTLQVLEIRNCGRVISEKMMFLLESLPKLREVEFSFDDDIRYRNGLKDPSKDVIDDHINNKEADENEEKNSNSSDERSKHPRRLMNVWSFPCSTTLTYLRIPVSTVGWDSTIEALEKTPYRWFYDVIGTLTLLQELHLQSIEPKNTQIHPFELTLRAGLGRWERLKQMEVLDVVRVANHGVGPGEIQWMTKHWSKFRWLAGLNFENNQNIECELLMRGAVPEIKVPDPKSRMLLHLSERHYTSVDSVR